MYFNLKLMFIVLCFNQLIVISRYILMEKNIVILLSYTLLTIVNKIPSKKTQQGKLEHYSLKPYAKRFLKEKLKIQVPCRRIQKGHGCNWHHENLETNEQFINSFACLYTIMKFSLFLIQM